MSPVNAAYWAMVCDSLDLFASISGSLAFWALIGLCFSQFFDGEEFHPEKVNFGRLHIFLIAYILLASVAVIFLPDRQVAYQLFVR